MAYNQDRMTIWPYSRKCGIKRQALWSWNQLRVRKISCCDVEGLDERTAVIYWHIRVSHWPKIWVEFDILRARQYICWIERNVSCAKIFIREISRVEFVFQSIIPCWFWWCALPTERMRLGLTVVVCIISNFASLQGRIGHAAFNSLSSRTVFIPSVLFSRFRQRSLHAWDFNAWSWEQLSITNDWKLDRPCHDFIPSCDSQDRWRFAMRWTASSSVSLEFDDEIRTILQSPDGTKQQIGLAWECHSPHAVPFGNVLKDLRASACHGKLPPSGLSMRSV